MFFKRDLQKRPTKETHTCQKIPTKDIYKEICTGQKRLTNDIYGQKRPTKETYVFQKNMCIYYAKRMCGMYIYVYTYIYIYVHIYLEYTNAYMHIYTPSWR